MSFKTWVTEYKDIMTVSLAGLSFLIACTSLFFSWRTAWYDRARLKISARVVREPERNKVYKIEVTVLNTGRRDAVLEGVLCHYEHGVNRHSYEMEGIVLKEKKRIIFAIGRQDVIISGDEGEVFQLEDITVLDIEGKEFAIPHSQQLVSLLIKEGF